MGGGVRGCSSEEFSAKLSREGSGADGTSLRESNTFSQLTQHESSSGLPFSCWTHSQMSNLTMSASSPVSCPFFLCLCTCNLLTDIYTLTCTLTLSKIILLHLFLLQQSNPDPVNVNQLHFWFSCNVCCIAEVCLMFFKGWNWKNISLLTGRATSLLNPWFEILLSKKTQSADAVKGLHCQFLLSLKTGIKHEVKWH